jgi:cell division protein FtsA
MGARIGYPNEYLSGNVTEEVTNPMYSTCIGLILRGYHDFENGRLRFVGEGGNIVHISAEEMKAVKDMIDSPEVPSTEEETEDRKKRNLKRTENFKKLQEKV